MRTGQPVVTIFGKPGCCLCDEALDVLRRVQLRMPFRLEKVDITSDPDLLDRYRYDIPVVHIDGREVFLQGVDEKQLLQQLDR
jgi:hypothetical protein